jgi:hypothetical protein
MLEELLLLDPSDLDLDIRSTAIFLFCTAHAFRFRNRYDSRPYNTGIWRLRYTTKEI